MNVLVRFLESRQVQREGGPLYVEGQTYSLRRDQARHWVNRGIAEIVGEGEPAPTVEVPEEEESGEDLSEESSEENSTTEEDADADGNELASSESVEGEDGGDSGQRPKPARRKRGSSSRSRSNDRDQ